MKKVLFCFFVLLVLLFPSCVKEGNNESEFVSSPKSEDAFILSGQGYKIEVKMSETSVTSSYALEKLKEEFVDGWTPYFDWCAENDFEIADDWAIEKDCKTTLFSKMVRLLKEKLTYRDEVVIGERNSYSYPCLTLCLGDGEAYVDDASLDSEYVDHRVVLVRDYK